MKSYNQMIVDYSVTRAKDYNEIDSTLETSNIPDDNKIIAASKKLLRMKEKMTTKMRFLYLWYLTKWL